MNFHCKAFRFEMSKSNFFSELNKMCIHIVERILPTGTKFSHKNLNKRWIKIRWRRIELVGRSELAFEYCPKRATVRFGHGQLRSIFSLQILNRLLGWWTEKTNLVIIFCLIDTSEKRVVVTYLKKWK